MFAASDPNLIIGELAVGGVLLFAMWRLIVWVREAPVRPEPWGAEIEKLLSEPDAVEVCPHCLTEQSSTAWFCDKCGRAVGPYNNLMPYVMVFSQGEVFRNGVDGRVRSSPLTIIGYLIYSLASYAVFAPLYWIFFFKQLQRCKAEELREAEIAGKLPQ